MNKLLRSLFLVAITIAFALPLYAGGPLGASGTTPRKYPSGSFPITYRIDRNGLGAFSNTTAASIAVYAFNQWDNISSAALSFTNGTQLARDVTTATDAYISGSGQFSDGVNPVVFDSSGAITDAKLGSGAKSHVLGFAGSAWTGTSTSYVEGYVIINGYLSGSGTSSDEDRYKATITHEVGHFLGIAHSQVTMHGDYSTMYPYISKPSGQMTLDPDDTAAAAMLYPATGYTTSVGAISGTVRLADNSNLSGVNVIAMDSASGAVYSTVVDYFSGPDNNSFSSKPSASGSYTISGLPPGRYFVRIEPVSSNFSGGSALASYSTPSNTGVAREWYNGIGEGGDMLVDNTNSKTGVVVVAGSTTYGINIVANESSTTSSLVYHNGVASVAFFLPGGSGGSITRYATKFTAPSNGSVVGIKFRLESNSSLPLNGTMTVTLHSNAAGSLAGIPGTSLGSVTIPFSDLAADQNNEIWLRGLGTATNFNSGDDFHVSITTNGVGTPVLLFDNGNPTANRSSYYTTANGWRNFPHGFSGGTPGYNMIVQAIYSSSATGNPQPEITLSSNALDFGRVRPGTNRTRTITLTNTGTATLTVNNTFISGPDSADYTVTAGGGAYSLGAGASRTIDVRFSPRTAGGGVDDAGTKSATLSIISNAPTSPNTIPLVGYGVMPNAAKLTASIALGSQRTGTTATPAVAIIRNSGNDTLNISSTSLTGADAGGAIQLTSSTGSMILPPDSTYTVRLRFAPTTRRGYAATLTVSHDDTTGSSVFSVAGTGIAPVVSTSKDSIAIGSVRVNATSIGSMVLRNSGDAPMIVGGIASIGTDADAFTVIAPSTFPITIAAGDSVAVQVRFAPTTRRTYAASVRVTSDAAPSTNDYALTGRGIAPVLVVPTLHEVGGSRVNTAIDGDSLEITNNGDAPLVISALQLSGPDAAEFTINTASLPITVVAGSTLRLPIRFQPTEAGVRTATLTIVSDDPNSQTTPVTIRGTGAQGEIAMISALDFGDVLVGSPSERDVRIVNIGNAPLTITALRTRAGSGFVLLSPPTLPLELPVFDTLTLRVRYLPTAAGSASDSVWIDMQNPAWSNLLRLSGRGVLPGMALSRSSIAYGVVPVGQERVDSFSIRNTGNTALANVLVTLTTGQASAFEILSPASTVNVLPGDSLVVRVRLKSQSASGALQSMVSVVANGGLASSVDLSATIVSGGLASTSTVDFGTRSQSMSIDTTMTLRNAGNIPIVIESISIASTKDGASCDCFVPTASTPMTVAPGAEATLPIRFAPSGNGQYDGEAVIVTDSPITPELRIALRGHVATTIGGVGDVAVTGGSSIALRSIMPNPASSQTEIVLSANLRQQATLELIDSRGVAVATIFSGTIESGDTRYRLDVSTLPAGVYHLMFRGAAATAGAKVVVVR